MLIFNTGRKKQQEAQRLLVRILNQQHQASNVRMADIRQEQRSNTTVPVVIVPFVRGKPLVEEVLPATTCDLSSVGIGLVAEQAVESDEILIGFRSDEEVFFVHAAVKHQERISPHFYQIGASAIAVLHASDYPLLATLPL
ncbi:MAG: hypothetical protein KF708_10140 [Pirellulales bacterium]|nr:hypothetical protein [Pirellulales bacterium]